jgi:hypothetical protein
MLMFLGIDLVETFALYGIVFALLKMRGLSEVHRCRVVMRPSVRYPGTPGTFER